MLCVSRPAVPTRPHSAADGVEVVLVVVVLVMEVGFSVGVLVRLSSGQQIRNSWYGVISHGFTQSGNSGPFIAGHEVGNIQLPWRPSASTHSLGLPEPNLTGGEAPQTATSAVQAAASSMTVAS